MPCSDLDQLSFHVASRHIKVASGNTWFPRGKRSLAGIISNGVRSLTRLPKHNTMHVEMNTWRKVGLIFRSTAGFHDGILYRRYSYNTSDGFLNAPLRDYPLIMTSMGQLRSKSRFPSES